ncbi:MAG: hypothetical protein ABEH90_00325 [Halolamina sp.]
MSDRHVHSDSVGRRTFAKGLGAAGLGAISLGFSARSVAAQKRERGTEVTLYAAQDIDAGTVHVSEDADGLKVTYETTGGWKLTETHLHVGDEFEDIPTTRPGNPIPGRFEHSGKPAGESTTSATYEVSLDGKELPVFIGAHAVVEHAEHGKETAWGNGRKFTDHESAAGPGRGRGSWATYFRYPLWNEFGDEK